MSFVICQFSVSIPLLFSTYSSASSHALSNAFVTSRYTIYRGFSSFSVLLCFLLVLLVLLARMSYVIHRPTRYHDITSAHDIHTSNIIIRRNSIIPSGIMIQTPYLLHL